MITTIEPREQPLISVHNPTAILVDVYYDSIENKPFVIKANIKGIDNLNFYTQELGVYNPMVYEIDDDNLKVTFALYGKEIFYSFMDSFDDFESPERVVEYLPHLTKQIEITFSDIDNTISSVFYTTLVNSATQIGEEFDPALYMKDTLCYVGGDNQVVYIYMWSNGFQAPVVTDPTLPPFTEDYIADYDDVIFLDYDDNYFRANIEDI